MTSSEMFDVVFLVVMLLWGVSLLIPTVLYKIWEKDWMKIWKAYVYNNTIYVATIVNLAIMINALINQEYTIAVLAFLLFSGSITVQVITWRNRAKPPLKEESSRCGRS